MASEPIVVDISSDEEDSGLGIDDVMVMDELSAPAMKKRKKGMRAEGGGRKDDRDDDCLILDCDPDNLVSIIGDKGRIGEDGADELVVVGEKGQLACRDYPHPRHLCASFPFSTSPHEKYCGLCHCYVCDSPAPCKYWGNGKLMIDHCHSTDKEGRWHSLREFFKKKNAASSQPLKLSDKLPSGLTSFQNPVTLNLPDPVQEPASARRSIPLRPCSATGTTNINPITLRHHQKSLLFYSRRHRLGPYPTVPNPPTSRIESVRRDHSAASTLAAQISYNSRLRKVGNTHSPILRTESGRREHSVAGTLAVQITCSSTLKKVGTTHSPKPRTESVQREHSVANTLAAQITYSSRLRKVRATHSGVSLPSSRPHNTLSSNNQMLNGIREKAYSATVTLQRPRDFRLQLCKAQSSHGRSADVSVDQMRVEPSRPHHTRLGLRKSLCLPLPQVDDSENLQGILASVASHFEVSRDNSDYIRAAPHPLAVSAESMQITQEVSRTKVNEGMVFSGQSNPVVGEFNSTNYDSTWLNNSTAQGILEQDQGEDPQVTTVQQPDPNFANTNLDVGKSCLDSLSADMEHELLDL